MVIINKINSNKITREQHDGNQSRKGNSIVILPTLHYGNKTEKFLIENNFYTVATDPTNTFQNQVRNTVKQNKILIPKDAGGNT